MVSLYAVLDYPGVTGPEGTNSASRPLNLSVGDREYLAQGLLSAEYAQLDLSRDTCSVQTSNPKLERSSDRIRGAREITAHG